MQLTVLWCVGDIVRYGPNRLIINSEPGLKSTVITSILSRYPRLTAGF
jgi:hypothetical protein